MVNNKKYVVLVKSNGAAVPDDDRPHWDIPCKDAAGRPRTLQVTVTRVGDVALIAPAGCSATVPPDRVRWLVTALTEARTTALRGDRHD